MFSKPTNNNANRQSAAQPAPQQRRADNGISLSNGPTPGARAPAAPARMTSMLGADLVFEGVIHGDGELMIDGALKGDVHITRLVVGEHAHIEGNVRCTAVEVRGRVVGNIEAQSVKLYETAFVEGDITHGQLSIDVGAYFQGRCQQFRPEAPVAAPVAPQPVAQPTYHQPNGAPAAYGQAAAEAPAAAQVIDFDQGHRG